MDRSVRPVKEDKKPKPPIKTYKWEDVRRSRKRGGYPWTHLYKLQFDEQEEDGFSNLSFVMEGSRPRSETPTSINTAASEGVSITEITDVPEQIDTLIVTSDPDFKVNLQDLRDDVEDEEVVQYEVTALETDSSDNLSQYLDKEERGPKERMAIVEVATTSAAKDENTAEEDTNKRKLSSASSFKKDLKNLAVVKKIREAQTKLKASKLSFPTSKLKSKSLTKRNKSLTEKNGTEIVKKSSNAKINPIAKPEYIHIPLRPSEGETDEFSCLELEEKPKEDVKTEKSETKIKDEAETSKIDNEPQEKEESTSIHIETKETVVKPNEKIQTIDDEEILDLTLNEEYDVKEPIKESKIEENQEQISDKTLEKPAQTLCESEDEIQIVPEEDPYDMLFQAGARKEEQLKLAQEEKYKRAVRSQSAEPTRKRKHSLESSYSRKSLSKLAFLKRIQDTSSRLRKSFSGFFSKDGKIKEVKKKKEKPERTVTDKILEKKKPREQPKEPVYIRIPLKPIEGENEELTQSAVDGRILETEEKQSSPEVEEIPGTNSVQFIILTAPSDDELLDYNSSDVPETPSSECGKTFFFKNKVEELRELAKDVVEDVSPGSRRKMLEPVNEEISDKSDELTEDKDVPKKEKKNKFKVELVEEPKEGVDKSLLQLEPAKLDEKIEILPDTTRDDKTTTSTSQQNEKMTVDAEDGLEEHKIPAETSLLQPDEGETHNEILEESKLIKPDSITVEKEAEDIKDDKKLVLDENAPALKKKVSFRSSKTKKKYKIVQEKEEVTSINLQAENNNQSMSVDEEKTYLDDKIIKSTSLEEDYNKWSKLEDDHEYEPVYPPEDEEAVTAPPTGSIMKRHSPEGSPMFSKFTKENTEETLSRNQESTEPKAQFQFEPYDVIESQPDIPMNDDDIKPKTESKFRTTMRNQKDKFRNKLQNMKRPSISMPDRSKFQKFKIEKPKFTISKPKFSMPKMPDMPKFGRKDSVKSGASTKANADSGSNESKKQRFDFGTYPRIFKKKKPKTSDFATIPRQQKTSESQSETRSTTGSIRIPLHSKDSMDNNGGDFAQNQEEHFAVQEVKTIEDYHNHKTKKQLRQEHEEYIRDQEEFHPEQFGTVQKLTPEEMQITARYSDSNNDDIERENNLINAARSHGAYQRPLDFHVEHHVDDDFRKSWERDQEMYIKEDEYNIKVTDLDSPDSLMPAHGSYAYNGDKKDNYSSGSSLMVHRQHGVLEEINPDEFFLRQKGISQDNIDVGIYLSSEIREAFRTPKNALATQIPHDYDKGDYFRNSNQSLPETEAPKRKQPPKKQKRNRRKTPKTSEDDIRYFDDEDDDPTISRPKRPSRRSRKSSDIPYQETITLDRDIKYVDEDRDVGVFGDDESDFRKNNDYYDDDQPQEVDEIIYHNKKYGQYVDKTIPIEAPSAPPRKNRSLKSLDDEMLRQYLSENIENNQQYKDIRDSMESDVSKTPPKRPHRSRTSSQSVTTSQLDLEVPCVEEPCFKDLRDAMGYAIVDKSKSRDPPLPPPRAPRSTKSSGSTTPFSTFPRSSQQVPVRPARNYSTLGQKRNKREAPKSAVYENKENLELFNGELEDEGNSRLQSGDVIRKMKDRPLPPPPRPPRKTRLFKDITSTENIPGNVEYFDENPKESVVSTQTDHLHEDFSGQEETVEHRFKEDFKGEPVEGVVVQRRLITPTQYSFEETVTHGSLIVEPLNGAKLLSDVDFEQKSTKERIVPVSRDYYSDDDETSSIPETFKNLKSPEEDLMDIPPPEVPQRLSSQEGTFNALSTIGQEGKIEKLRVTDLDVDTLTVNRILADKISVSEVESSSIKTGQISSESTALKVSELELPSEVLQEIVKELVFSREKKLKEDHEKTTKSHEQEEQLLKLKKTNPSTNPSKTSYESSRASETSLKTPNECQKQFLKEIETEGTPLGEDFKQPESPDSTTDPQGFLEEHIDEDMPPQTVIEEVKTAKTEASTNATETPQAVMDFLEEDIDEDSPPKRPPRQSERTSLSENPQEPEVDDQPPPRPTSLPLDYVPSLPPASFFALKAEQYVESQFGEQKSAAAPAPIRRKRHLKAKPRTRSSSSADKESSSGEGKASSSKKPLERTHRAEQPSIAQLSGQLLRVCATSGNETLKRLMTHVTENVARNADGQQDAHVIVIILLVLIAGLILLGYGDQKTVVHLHHWEYFNPPKDM